MPNLHPLIVHFPIALFTVGFAVDILALAIRREEVSRYGWWTQLAGTLGLASAIVTGLLGEKSVVMSAPARSLFDVHEQVALVVAGVFAALVLWRASQRGRLPRSRETIYLLVYGAGLLGMWYGAWYGGELVYRFGVGTMVK